MRTLQRKLRADCPAEPGVGIDSYIRSRETTLQKLLAGVRQEAIAGDVTSARIMHKTMGRIGELYRLRNALKKGEVCVATDNSQRA